MQSIGPTAARHHATCVFINDIYLPFLHHVFDIAIVDRVSAEQLRNSVNLFGNFGETLLRFHFLLFAVFGSFLSILTIQIGVFHRQIRQHEGIGIIGAKRHAALLGEIRLLLAFVDPVEEFFLNPKKFWLVEIGVHLRVCLIKHLPPFLRLLNTKQQLVLGITHLHLQQLKRGFALLFI